MWLILRFTRQNFQMDSLTYITRLMYGKTGFSRKSTACMGQYITFHPTSNSPSVVNPIIWVCFRWHLWKRKLFITVSVTVAICINFLKDYTLCRLRQPIQKVTVLGNLKEHFDTQRYLACKFLKKLWVNISRHVQRIFDTSLWLMAQIQYIGSKPMGRELDSKVSKFLIIRSNPVTPCPGENFDRCFSSNSM